MQTSSHQPTPPASPATIGGWFEFCVSPLSKQNPLFRFQIRELQKADHGRKYGRKDKRPLDPPPVIATQCYQIPRMGTNQSVEQEFDFRNGDLTLGLLCHVDLFPDTISNSNPGRQQQPQFQASFAPPVSCMQWPNDPPLARSSPANMGYAGGPLGTGHDSTVLVDPHDQTAPERFHAVEMRAAERTPDSFPWGTGMCRKVSAAPQPSPQFGSTLYPEEAICTDLLAGETVVQCSLVDYEGKKTAMFVFSDLSVKREGRFVLRYRIFNIYGKSQSSNVVHILAECYGGPFEVYSTKSFPGLQASTDLTRRLSLLGIRVNSRHKERKGWKRNERREGSNEPARHRRHQYQFDTPTSPMANASSRTITDRTNGRKPPFILGPPFAHGFSRDLTYPPPHSPAHPAGMPFAAEGMPRTQAYGAFGAPTALGSWPRPPRSPSGLEGGDLSDVSMRGTSASSGTTEEDGSTHGLSW